jgi:hypothetical protein
MSFFVHLTGNIQLTLVNSCSRRLTRALVPKTAILTSFIFSNNFSTFLFTVIGDGITLVSSHRKYYTLAQEHLRKALAPMCNEAEQSNVFSHLQQAVFGSKGMPVLSRM